MTMAFRGSRGSGGVWFAKRYVPRAAGSIDGVPTEQPHDHAIVRAERALYIGHVGVDVPEADPHVDGDAYRTVFVGRLAATTTDESLREALVRFGDIVRVRVVRNIVTGESMRYGFVEFAYERGCRNAYQGGMRLVVDGAQVILDYERARVMQGFIPRRLGGGFGGKKESGQLRFGSRDRPFREPFNKPDFVIPHDQRHDACWREIIDAPASTAARDRDRRRVEDTSRSGDWGEDRDRGGERGRIGDRDDDKGGDRGRGVDRGEDRGRGERREEHRGRGGDRQARDADRDGERSSRASAGSGSQPRPRRHWSRSRSRSPRRRSRSRSRTRRHQAS